MKYTLVAWMRDRPGVLNRVSGMLRRRNFNIDSLQVGHSETPGISRMTFVVDGDERMVDQVIKQLRKVVDVTRIEDMTEKKIVAREMALIRVRATGETRSEIVQITDIYRGEIVDVAPESMVVQIVASEEKVDALIDLLADFHIIEMVRTGKVALVRGNQELRNRRGTTVWRASANGAAESEKAGRFATGGV
ncbi:MAG: acetolactate synthase small subunit [Caldilineaceae bacterium]